MKSAYKPFEKRLSLFLTAGLIFGSTFPARNVYANDNVKKYETVYVKLNSDGEKEEIIVSNWLKDSKYLDEVADITNAENIRNINDDKNPESENGKLIFKPSHRDVIYQGTTNKNLPISTDIKYYLDGKQMSADEIAGKSGKVKIQIDFKNNTARALNVNGKLKKISIPFAVEAIVSFDSKKFSNIKAENSRIVSDGNNQVVMFMGFPGLEDTFDLNNSKIDQLRDIDLPQGFTVTADARNFKLKPITIAASSNLPDSIKNIDNNYEDLKKLQNDITTAINSNNVLKRLDPNDTIKDLIRNPKKTDDAKLLVDDLFKYYDMNTDIIDILPKYITDENISLFDKTKADLREADINYILDNEVLRGITDRLTDEQINKSRVLIDDFDELQTLDMDTFDKALEIINAYDDLKTSIDIANSLYYKLKWNDDHIDTMNKVSKYKDRIFSLMDSAEEMVESGALTESDIDVMLRALVKKKTEENSEMFAGLFPQNETDHLTKEQAQKLTSIIGQGMKSGEIGITTGSQLNAMISSGYVPEPYRTKMITMLTSKIQSRVAQQINQSVTTAKSLLLNVQNLQNDIQADIGYDYRQQLRDALDFTVDLLPEMMDLKDEVNAHRTIMDKAMDLVSDEDDMQYYKYWANRAKEMKTDMDDNDSNVEIMRDLLKEYDDPKVSYFYSLIPLLRDDFDQLRPIINALSDDLDIPKYHESYKKSPETIKTLLDIKRHLDEKRYLADTLKLSLNDEILNAARDVIKIADRMDEENKLEDSKEKVTDMISLLETKDVVTDLSDNYDNFSGKLNDMPSQVSFVMKTDDIEAIKAKINQVTKSAEKKGFFKWFNDLL